MSGLRMLDLFAGRGGASRAMVDRGWDVTRVELDERFPAEHRDIRTYHPTPGAFDLVWASPPCTEFTKTDLPWSRATAPAPSMDLLHEALRVIREAMPRWWVIENVRGAQPWFLPVLGRSFIRCGPVYLWGAPPFALWPRVGPYKEAIGGGKSRAALRSQIPYEVSRALAVACELEAEAA